LILGHYGGIDELAIIWMPAVMGIGLWLILRTGKQEPSEEETTEVSSEASEEQ
jgi:hypothetical protein